MAGLCCLAHSASTESRGSKRSLLLSLVPSCHGDSGQGMLFSCRILFPFGHLAAESGCVCLQTWEIPELPFHLYFHPSLWGPGGQPHTQGSCFKEGRAGKEGGPRSGRQGLKKKKKK